MTEAQEITDDLSFLNENDDEWEKVNQETRKELGRKKVEFLASHLIKTAYRYNGFEGIIIHGKQGDGKTAFAMKNAFMIYNDWRLVFRYMYFDFKRFVNDVGRWAEEGKRIPVVILDDFGSNFNKYAYFEYAKEDIELMGLFKGMFDVIREQVSGILITTPSPRGLMKFLGEYPWLYTKIFRMVDTRYKNGIWKRLAKYYRHVVMPSGKSFDKYVGDDEFYCLLPDFVYQKYKERRKGYTRYVFERLREKGYIQ